MNAIDYWYKKYMALKETERIPKPELTWEDIKEIQRLLDVVWSEQDITAPIDEDTIYKEALKRFKEAKR